MKKIAFIGLAFHQKTGSTQFLIDLLMRHYTVDLFLDFGDTPADKSNKDAFRDQYDVIICLQIMPTPKKLYESLCQNIVMVPMYEHVQAYTLEQWIPYLRYKILSFSKTLHENLLRMGGDSYHVQFFPPAVKESLYLHKEKLKVFFWQRSVELDFNLIKKLLSPDIIEQFYFHRTDSDRAKDVWFKPPSDVDIQRYKIEFSSWFENKTDLIERLSECDVYITPRMYEGIGMGFLEAMAMGKCVIAPDFPTMNEYIVDQQNGLLFDPNNPKRLDLSKFMELGMSARKSINQGYVQWCAQEERICDFLNRESKSIRNPIHPLPRAHNANMVFSRNLNFIHNYLSAKSFMSASVVLYGAGTGAELVASILGKKIAYIVDIDPKKHLQSLKGFCIRSPLVLKEDETTIIITVFGREEKIYHYLRNELEIPSKRIVILELFN